MARYFIELQYDGTAYFGWQRQPDATTVEGVIEEKLSMLLRRPTEIVGAGRTDTGVNASFYTAHFDSEATIDCAQLCYKLNKVLPVDIAIMRIYEVEPTLHARFDAKEREYTYFLTPHKSPFRRFSAWHFTAEIDVERMNQAARKLLEYDDFTSFAKLNSITRPISATYRTPNGSLRATAHCASPYVPTASCAIWYEQLSVRW